MDQPKRPNEKDEVTKEAEGPGPGRLSRRAFLGQLGAAGGAAMDATGESIDAARASA